MLIQKRLYRNLLEFKVERLPQHWNEFCLENSKPLLPRRNENTQDHFKKTMAKQITRIDSIRQHVGDMDIKIFHALDIKNKWKTHEAHQDSPELYITQDDEEYIKSCSNSDEDFDDMTTGHEWISENPIKIIMVDSLAILVVNVPI